MSENLPASFFLACHPKTMQRHLKTSLLNHELRHKEGIISDPESPALLSVALVNWTIVCSAFAAQLGLFIMCLAHVSRVYYRFIVFCVFVLRNLGHSLTQKTEKFDIFWEENLNVVQHKCFTLIFKGYLQFNRRHFRCLCLIITVENKTTATLSKVSKNPHKKSKKTLCITLGMSL